MKCSVNHLTFVLFQVESGLQSNEAATSNAACRSSSVSVWQVSFYHSSNSTIAQ